MSKSKKPNTTSVYSEQSAAVLSYKRVDPERFLSLPSGKFTSPSTITPLMFSVIAMAAVYSIAFYKREQYETVSEWLGITKYYGIPIVIFGFSFWALSILIFKYFKIRAQRKALSLRIVPDTLGFVLSSSTVDQVIENIESSVEEPRKFMLLNRIILVLKSIRNVGRIADIDEMLMSSADADDSRIENSYTLIRGFVWAIPVLGFIGTIFGLTETIGKFSDVLKNESIADNAGHTSLVEGMKGAIGGLDTAFFTTGLALVAALLIHLLLTFIRKSDDELLDETRDYCHQYIVSRVRV